MSTATMSIAGADVAIPEQGHVAHIVPADIVVMRRQDWLAIADAVAVAKVGNVLTASQRARLDGIQIADFDYVVEDVEPEADEPDDEVTWAINPEVGDRVGWIDTEYPAAGERFGSITSKGFDDRGRSRVYLAGDHNAFGTVLLVAAFNGVLHEDQTDIARIITD